MGRNYLFFLIGLVVLLVFSFAFCWATIYAEQPLVAILAFIGFVATLVIAIAIGLSAREESTGLSWWFFIIAGLTALLLVWFLTRFGVQMKIW
ncbi:MAG: hypothetical protein NTU62_16450 [Spirochaetes bacterium]|jgi:uncharacterized membrane protein YjfL (UPF0719 family)|nr:hypothetical protein [Spirochaetota bacterium]